MRCTCCTCEKHPTGVFGVGDAVAAQVPGAITRFQPAQTCSGLSVPLVALLKRALASTLLGGAVENAEPLRSLSHLAWPLVWRFEAMERMSRTIVMYLAAAYGWLTAGRSLYCHSRWAIRTEYSVIDGNAS